MILFFSALLACTSPEPGGAGSGSDDDAKPDDADTGGDGADTGDTGGEPAEIARWTFLIWMDGDNDLEEYVVHDLNELEQVGSGDGVNVVVQADRIPGYDDSDGDWTGTRRYYITQDNDLEEVSSPVIADLGEVDMGAPESLEAFLAWAAEEYPAEQTALILWNHGDGWSIAPPGIASDDTSGSMLSIARGHLDAALRPNTEARGPLDLIGFDACNMATWEVAHALREHGRWMTASETWVGWGGYDYLSALSLLRGTDATGADLATELARASIEISGEYSHTAVDLSQMDALAASIDALAARGLADSAAGAELLTLKDSARGADAQWGEYYLDLGDLASVTAGAADPDLAAAAAGVQDALSGAVLTVYGNAPYAWTTGLTIFFMEGSQYVSLYANGAGATWSQATRWDEYLESMGEL